MKNLLEIIKDKKICVFDLDGTIADTEKFHWVAHKELLKKMNVNLNDEDIQKYIGHNDYQIFEMIEKDFGVIIDKEKMKQKRLAIFRDLVKQYNLLPHEEVIYTIKNFKGKKIILSSQNEFTIKKLLLDWGILEYFEKIISLEFTRESKIEIIPKMGPANDIVWFEDNPKIINEGKYHGYTMVGVRHYYNKNIEIDADYIIDNTNKTNALFVGLCTKDIIYYVENLPKFNKKIKTEEFKTYIGGPATNAAITFSMLGGNATIATCLGDSEESKAIIQKLNNYGVTVLNYSLENKYPNTASIIISNDGDRTVISGQNQFNHEIKFDLNNFNFDLVLFDGNQQEISLDILDYFKKSNFKNIVLDAGSWKNNISKFLVNSNIIISSEDFVNKEGLNLLQLNLDESKYKAITRGGKSIISNLGEIPITSSSKVIDTLGAGDIFHGAFCFYYFNNKNNFYDSLKLASYIASKSVEFKGPREWINHI